MAKKVAVARKAPTKVCAKCGAENHARQVKCKGCGEPFPSTNKAKKKKGAKGKVGTNGTLNVNELEQARKLVKLCGSIESAQRVLKSYGKYFG